MSDHLLAILLGLLAAFLFAVAAYRQQRVARMTDIGGRTVVSGTATFMSRLLRSPAWLSGWSVNLAGFGVQATALHFGSIATVQPLLATQLLFAMPLASRELRNWPRARDWASGLAICGSLVILLVAVGASPMSGQPNRATILVASACVLGLIVLLFAVSPHLPRAWLIVLAAGAGGLCFSLTAVFIKLTTADLIHHGVTYTATDWVGYALAGSTLLGLVVVQGAFAHGPLPWAVATKDAVNPIASYVLGVLAFPTALPTDPAHLTAIAAAGLLLIVGSIGLAHTPSAHQWMRRADEAWPGHPAHTQTPPHRTK